MRIALVCTEKLPVPPIRGGAIQIYIEGILPYLQQRHDITVVSVADPKLPGREEHPRLNFVRLSRSGYLNRVAETLARENCDVIHVFNRPRWVGPIRRACPHSRLVISIHNEMFLPEKIKPEEGAACLEAVDRVMTVSRFIAEGIEALYPQAAPKLKVVYSAADPQAYLCRWDPRAQPIRENLLEKLGLPPGAAVILNVSRLSPKKGNHLVIRALDQVLPEHPNAVAVLVGSKWYGMNDWDDYGKGLKKLAAQYPGHVILTGFVPPAEVPAYYTLGDIFVCSSQWQEPLARVHYEAMAAGLPILTTRRGGNPEVVEDLGNGWVIDNCLDPAELGRFINLLLARPDLAQAMGKRGRELVDNRFNWSRVAQELLEIYEAAAGFVPDTGT